MSRETRDRSDRYEVVVFDDYEFQGQKRSRAFRVGSLVTIARGFALYIPPGISITGKAIAVPEKTPLGEVDVLEAYQSAADLHGV